MVDIEQHLGLFRLAVEKSLISQQAQGFTARLTSCFRSCGIPGGPFELVKPSAK